MHEHDQKDQLFSIKNFIVPFTTVKAVHWIIIIGFFVYSNSLINGFLGDDWGQLIYNSPVHSLTNILYFFSSSTFYVNGAGSFGLYYKPLMMVVYSLIYTVFGPNPFIYHLLQLLFHIANSCLLLVFFKRFFSQKLSFFLALFFLIHPINNESVVSIAALQEVLYFFFGILSLLLLPKKSNWITFIVAFCWLLALFSKETGILFIIISFVYGIILKLKKSYYFAAVVVICLYLLLRSIAVGLFYKESYLYIVSESTFRERLYSIPSIIYYYISHFLYPIEIASSQQWILKQITPVNFFVPLLVDVLFFGILTGFAYFFFRKHKKIFITYLFFFLWFLLGMGFYLQLIPLDTTVADRWMYFPFVGFLGITGTISTYFIPKIKSKTAKKIIILITLSALVLLAVRTYSRTFNWANDYSLCSHDIRTNKNSYILELCIGNEYRKLKKYNIAIAHLKKAVSLYPTYYPAMDYLALTYDDEGNYQKAIQYYKDTLNNNNWGDGADMLATLLAYHGEFQESKTIAEKNLKKQPQNAQLWYALALAEYRLHDRQAALVASMNAYQLAPNNLTRDVYNGIQKNISIKFDGK